MDAKAEAVEFFKQLKEFSALYLASMHLPANSPWGGGAFLGGIPVGAIIHFTADDDFLRVLRWFQNGSFQAKVSAHFVVANRRQGSADTLLQDYPLIKALPVTVVQCEPLDEMAWHATWANTTCLGIENVNVGEVRKRSDGKWAWYANNWLSLYDTLLSPEPVLMYGKYWAPYPVEQIEANAILLKYLSAYFGWANGMKILGHEQVQSSKTRMGSVFLSEKSDPGPAYPINEMRDAVFGSDAELDSILHGGDTFNEYQRSEKYMVALCGVLKHDTSTLSGSIARTAFTALLGALPAQGGVKVGAGQNEGVWLCQCALKVLGYAVDKIGSDTLDWQSLQVFLKLMGMSGISSGVQIAQALIDRLKNRGFIG